MNKVLLAKITKPLSTGLASLDGLIGGCYTGNLFLIEEDNFLTTYSYAFIAYYSAQALMENSTFICVCANKAKYQHLIQNIPKNIESKNLIDDSNKNEYPNKTVEEKLDIAWRYSKLKPNRELCEFAYGKDIRIKPSQYNLQEKWFSLQDNNSKNYIDENINSIIHNNDPNIIRQLKTKIISIINDSSVKSEHQKSATNLTKTLADHAKNPIRIVVDLSQTLNKNGVTTITSDMRLEIVRQIKLLCHDMADKNYFIHALVCLPFPSHNKIENSEILTIQRIENICDTVIKIKTINLMTNKNNLHIQNSLDIDGYIDVTKISDSYNLPYKFGPPVYDLGFKLKKTQLIIMKISLPPENEEQNSENSSNDLYSSVLPKTQNLTCSPNF